MIAKHFIVLHIRVQKRNISVDKVQTLRLYDSPHGEKIIFV